ncbi:MAG TPA: tRNA glutamyl-Q(34) synthetase GluQRS [Porticoccaceae bacterium]|nr:tRNA glutamyl-Q(34) synthetase GluQRS [Porticoccaceae bacterium]
MMYVGRFAPSPTGPLHLGSLFAAVTSYLDARAHHGTWLVRMEDIDSPREVPGAADTILTQLETHGLNWDGPVLYQSRRIPAYREAWHQLRADGLVYPCNCSRKRLRHLEGIYDGRCRTKTAPGQDDIPCAWRVRTDIADRVHWNDLFCGPQQFDLKQTIGDFIVLRKDGLFAYQLAVSVDDAFQSITHVIRGGDLLDSTPRQLHLLQLLSSPAPRYGHTPILTDSSGLKLSKQRFAPAINPASAQDNITRCLGLIGLTPPTSSLGAPASELLQWAAENWHRNVLKTGESGKKTPASIAVD